MSGSPAMPVAFVAHGAPLLALEAAKGAELREWASSMPRPRAIVAISPHWQTRDPTIGTTTTLPLLYDFSGFPPELYTIQYPAPGAPDVAKRLEQLLAKVTIGKSPDRKLDHGVWVPALHMYPEADVPIVQLSLPRREPPELFELGRMLAPLVDEAVLLFCTGVLVHNLRSVDFGEGAPTPPWALEFDAWCADALARRDYDALVDFRVRAPKRAMAHPTEEHFLPLLVAAGAASTKSRAASFPIVGFEYGSLSRRCVQFG
jgi:4,5-DOPA dioxygenase extradiol